MEPSILSGHFEANLFPSPTIMYKVTLLATWMLPLPKAHTLSTKVQCLRNIRMSWEFHEGSCSLLNTLQLCLLSRLPMTKLRLDRQLVVRDELSFQEDLWCQLS